MPEAAWRFLRQKGVTKEKSLTCAGEMWRDGGQGCPPQLACFPAEAAKLHCD